MSDLIRVGIITEGSGGHLPGYLRPMAAYQGIESVAVAAESREIFERVRAGLGPHGSKLQTYSSYQEMLVKARPGFVLVTVEAHHAPERIAAALESGAHVLTEKPPATRLEDYERVARLADSKHRDLTIGFASRLHPAAIKAKELIERGYLGRPYGATMNWIGDHTRLTKPEYAQSWLAWKAKAGGGKLIFHGIHYLDLIQHLTGERISEVAGFARNVGNAPGDVEDAAVVVLHFQRGMVGALHTGYYLDRGYDNSIMIWGSSGWLRIDLPGHPPLTWYSTQPGAPQSVQHYPTPSETDDYFAMTTNALDAARGLMKPFMTTADGLSVMRVVFAAYRSSETGARQRISWT